MKRTVLTTSLVGSAAAGLLAITTPAWAQATTYPEGTDCSAIQNSANRTDCLNQMNESRQNPTPTAPSPAPDAAAPGAAEQPGAATQPTGTTGATQNTPSQPATSGSGDMGSGGTTGGATQ
jgi:cytoskeletal protein RodZ